MRILVSFYFFFAFLAHATSVTLPYSFTAGSPISASQMMGNFASITSALSSTVSSPWVASSSNIYFNTGSVGVGSSAPAYKLDVGGSMQYAGSLYNTGVLQPLVVASNFTSTSSLTISVSNLNTGTYSVANIKLNMYPSVSSGVILYLQTISTLGVVAALSEYNMISVVPSGATYSSTGGAQNILTTALENVGGGWDIVLYNPAPGVSIARTHTRIQGVFCYAGLGATRVDASGFATSPAGVIVYPASGTLTGHYSVTYYP